MTVLIFLLLTSFFSGPAHAESGALGTVSTSTTPQGTFEINSTEDFLALLARYPQGSAARAVIAAYLQQLSSEELDELMEAVHDADLLSAFLDAVLLTSEGRKVDEGLRLAALMLMENGDNDHLASAMANTSLDTSETAGTEYGEGHGYLSDPTFESAVFNTQEMRRPGDLSRSLAEALTDADNCQRTNHRAEGCATVPADTEPKTTTLTVDVFDDDFDEVVEAEVKESEKNDSNFYRHHFTWTGGRGGVDFATPYKMDSNDVFNAEASRSWGGNANEADVGGAEVTDGKKGTAKKPAVDLDNFSISIAGDFRRQGDSVLMFGDDNTHLRFIGYEAKSFIGAEVNKTGVKASASGSLNTYLARARSYESLTLVEEETWGIALKEYTEANIGANAGLGTSLKVGLSGVELSAEAKAFLGAEAGGWLGGGISLCKIKVDLRGKGNVSAGIGGKVTGTVAANWSEGKFGLGGELAGTLGLGGGTGANVWIDAQSLVKTPGVVVDCFGDKLEELGEMTHMMGVAHTTRDVTMDVAHATRDTTLWMAEETFESNATLYTASAHTSIAMAEEVVDIADSTIDFTMDTAHSTRDISLEVFDWASEKVNLHVVGDVGGALETGLGHAENLVVDQVGGAFVDGFNAVKGLFGGCSGRNCK